MYIYIYIYILGWTCAFHAQSLLQIARPRKQCSHPTPTTPPQPPQLTPHPNHPTPTTPANTPIVRITTQQNPGAQKSRR